MERTVLVIEDDDAIRRGVLDALAFAGFSTLEAATGKEGLRLALNASYDIALLDLVLPGMLGLEILAEVRKMRPTTPVIILTALGQEKDRIRGLKEGADDYVVKPFSIKELIARIDAVLRRSPERPQEFCRVEIGGVSIDFERHEILRDGKRFDLSEREEQLLSYLVNNPGRAISRDEILQRVWRINPRAVVQTRTIDMHIGRLREKLGDDSSDPRLIVTVRGKGYMVGVEPSRGEKPGAEGGAAS